MNESTTQTPDTNTPVFDINSIDMNTLNTDVEARPGSDGDATQQPDVSQAHPETETPAEGEPAKEAQTDKPVENAQPQENGDKKATAKAEPTIEQRYRELQQQYHNDRLRLKELEQAVKAPARTDQEATELLKQVLKKQLEASQPKPPTIEDLRETFNKTAENDPFEAVMAIVKSMNQSQSDTLTKDQVHEIVSGAIAQIDAKAQQARADANVRNLVAAKKIDINTDTLDKFGQYLTDSLSVIGDEAAVKKAVEKICLDPAKLERQYDLFTLMTNKDTVINKVREETEAKVAEKLQQQPPSLAKSQTPAKAKTAAEMMVEGDIGSGFDGYFRL